MAKPKSPPSLSSQPQLPTLDQRERDIIGIALLFVSVAGFVCLYGQGLPPLLKGLRDALQSLAGWGAFIFPLLIAIVATLLLRGHQRFSLGRTSVGFVLIFLVIVAAQNLMFGDRLPIDKPLSPQDVAPVGGLLGWIVGWPIRHLLGLQLGWLLLVFTLVVAGILIADRPLAEILDAMRVWVTGLFVFENRQAVRQEEGTGAENETVRDVRTRTGTPNSALSRRELRPAFAGDSSEEPEPNKPSRHGNLLESMWEKMHSGFRPADRTQVSLAQANAVLEAEPRLSSAELTLKFEETPSTSLVPATKGGERTSSTPRLEALSASQAENQLNMPLFALPPMELLHAAPAAVARRSQAEIEDRAAVIVKTLDQFGIEAKVAEVASGPTVTRYEIQLAPGIKVSKIVGLADNLSMSLAAIDVRVEAPIPGKAAIGLEVPNAVRSPVLLRECLENPEFQHAESKLTVVLGKDVSGQFRYADITKMPHLLIGGSTNSGKSICLNALIASLVYRATPREVKLLMIDPKRVELSLWEGIPHLMHPVVKDVKQAAGTFRAAIKEMDRRYKLFEGLGTRNIDGYNARVPEQETLPYVVLIVDELADLMMQQGAEVEQSICRLAQMARATGIHLVIATQRPSVDIITGTIKANISSRIAFAVASQVDSRTILDMVGADRLIGRGDMLFMPIDAPKPIRIQGAYLSESETNALVNYLKQQEKPNYTISVSESGESDSSGLNNSDEVDDQFFEQAVRLVVNNGQASTSMLQRRFRIGYTRAARIVEMMEERGVVGPLNGAKPREILVSRDEVERMFNPGGPIPSVENYRDEGE